MSEEAEAKIAKMWMRGAQPRSVMREIRRLYGFRLTFEEVRLRFVGLCEAFS